MYKLLIILFALNLVACASGEYRIPYSNNREVVITRDFVTHIKPTAKMYDMKAVNPPAFIRAAAAGWVRFIEDGNSISGTGKKEKELGNNNYVWIEHPYPFCQNPNDPVRATWPGKPTDYDQTCKPCQRRYCNEWTVYVHMSQGSVRGTSEGAAGLSEDDWVEAGALLGVEDDIGVADGVHLHWHVAVINPEWTPSANGDYEDFLSVGRPEKIPVVCTSIGKRVLWRNVNYIAAPCP